METMLIGLSIIVLSAAVAAAIGSLMWHDRVRVNNAMNELRDGPRRLHATAAELDNTLDEFNEFLAFHGKETSRHIRLA